MKITIIKKGLIIYLAALVAGIIFASFYGGPVAYAPLFALFLIYHEVTEEKRLKPVSMRFF